MHEETLAVITEFAEPILQKEVDEIIAGGCISANGYTKRFVGIMNAYASYQDRETNPIEERKRHLKIWDALKRAVRIGGLNVNTAHEDSHILLALHPLLQYNLLHIRSLNLAGAN